MKENPFAAPASTSIACSSIVAPHCDLSFVIVPVNESPPYQDETGSTIVGSTRRSPPRLVGIHARWNPMKSVPTVGTPADFARSSVIVEPNDRLDCAVNAGTPEVPGNPEP